jgi:hypothetical protein
MQRQNIRRQPTPAVAQIEATSCLVEIMYVKALEAPLEFLEPGGRPVALHRAPLENPSSRVCHVFVRSRGIAEIRRMRHRHANRWLVNIFLGQFTLSPNKCHVFGYRVAHLSSHHAGISSSIEIHRYVTYHAFRQHSTPINNRLHKLD